SEVQYCVTDEMYLEIDRSADPHERARRRRFVNGFRRLGCDPDVEQRILIELRPLFPEVMTVSDESDHRHLAKAIAGGANFFITRDTAQVERAAEVHSRYGLLITRPLDFVIHLDAQLRRAEYVPA